MCADCHTLRCPFIQELPPYWAQIVSLYFLKFWRVTGDRFFLFFSASFLIESINRGLFWKALEPSEGIETYYILRLIEYSLILIAVLDKNRRKKKPLS
jgi:hypothetical protein